MIKIQNAAILKRDEEMKGIKEHMHEHETGAAEQYERMFNSLTGQLQEMVHKSDERDEKIERDIKDLNSGMLLLKDGILNLQGRDFKETCRKLLQSGHVITDFEYEDIVQDHCIYNSLGGNHKGDELFHMVQEKYKKQL